MINFIPFTDEQKHRANNVDLVDFLSKRGERLIPAGREKRLESNKSITVRGNSWYDHAEETGGHAIDFLKKQYNMTFPEAVTTLLGGDQGQFYRATPPHAPVERKPFVLPVRNPEMRQTFAYLLKGRKIDKDVVSHFAKAKTLYESRENIPGRDRPVHNCVFVGTDEKGVPRHAHKHGLNSFGTSFKRNVPGCEPSYSFHHVGTDDRLYVFEAPIDLMSFASIFKEQWQEASYVALCGTSGAAVEWMTRQYPQLQDICFCLDQDEAGRKATERLSKIMEEKGLKCSSFPSNEKDWNLDLQTMMGEVEQAEQATLDRAPQEGFSMAMG